MFKNGIVISPKNESKNLLSILERYLHLLRYESVNKTSSSIYVNPWRLSLDRVLPNIHLRSLTNLSELFSQRFTRALFVRHPFERLASAYQERIATLPKDRIQSEPYYDNIRKVICRRYMSFNQTDYLSFGHHPCEHKIPSFEHFLRYILQNSQIQNGIDRMDAHWKPYSLICQVCQFHYNFIGKYETFNDDLTRFLQRLGISHWNMNKRRGASGQTTWQYKQFYSTLSDQLICQLKHLYQDDFTFFNYHLEDYVNRTTLTCSSSSSTHSMKRIIKN